ncbi:MAG TPA: glycine/sarcosine/betaine reductase component B subunit [Acidimicrobiales bacterium]|nr:glycine/sarcosine/betaine reductase component B subunit [Acidimicrobiales bacterium]
MALIRLVHQVREVGFGERTDFADGVLTVSADEARGVLADPALAETRLSWVSPNQSARIVKVLDAVEPRTKGPGGGGIFPGFVGQARLQGSGETHVLRGVIVVTAGYLPRAQEALVDLSGPAASLSPLGAAHNLVIEFVPAPGASWEQVEGALRRSSLRLAAALAEASLGAEPDAVEEFPPPSPRTAGSSLPRVGAVTNLQTQGLFKDVFVYGRSFGAALPTLLDPGELDDGAVVSGQFGHPALKNPTFMHQNHPVVAELRRRHGRDLEFAGVVISPEPVDQGSKEMVSAFAARVCAAAGFDAAIVTKEGGGNADADVALKMDALSDLGIQPVGLFGEMAGADGTGPSVVVAPERATAMVSTGNYDHRLQLPEVEKAYGGDQFTLANSPATAAFEVPTAVVYCALNPLGWGHLTARAG